MVIVVMDYGGNMKGSDKPKFDLELWNKIFGKMKILLDIIERTNPSIDDLNLRWVSDRIEYFNAEERLLSKEEMAKANQLWLQYK